MKTKEIRKRAAIVLMVALAAVGGTACGKQEDSSNSTVRKDAEEIKQENQVSETQDPDTDETAAAEAAAASEEAGEKRTEYPLTITTYGYDGAEITTVYEKAPEKVIAVYQGSVETMLALGLEEQLVAAAGLDNEVPADQKAAFSSVKYLDEFTPSLETVTMLEPDMIFSWSSLFSDKTLGEGKDWVEKGTNIYINTNTRPGLGEETFPRTLENEYNDILNIGKIFDVQDKAEDIVADMQKIVTETIEKTKSIEEKPSALMIEYMNDSYTNYGANNLGGDMITKLGGELANPDGADMGKEDIIAINPDVIFVVYMPYEGDDPEQLEKEKLEMITNDETFASLDAVKNERVVPIMLSEMYASATRTKDGITTIAKGLYPEMAE